jgi:hypothetical protein
MARPFRAGRNAMRFLGSLLVVASFVFAAFHYSERLADKERKLEARKWLEAWLWRGLAAPLLLWLIFNQGRTPILPPFVAAVALGKVHWGWFGRMIALTTPAIAIIGSYWAAVTYAWLIATYAADNGQGRKVALELTVWGVVLSPFVLLSLFIGRLEGIGLSLLPLLVLVLHRMTAEAHPEHAPKPMYARAVGHLKMGKYAAAEQAVIEELEDFEDDFDGWMMLAELYATHFHDVGEASRTIREMVTQPDVTPSQISIAYHKLAEWHLKLGSDPGSARRALEAICTRLPGTHLARMARLGMNHIPATDAEFEAQRKGHTIRMPALNDALDQPAVSHLDPAEAKTQAAQCVAKLKQDPNDVAAREKLARLMAEELGQAAKGIEQLGLLMEMPGQPENKMAEWLAMVAAWQLTQLHDKAAARTTLERLRREHPQSPQAFAAQRRLSLLDMEAKIERIKAASGLPLKVATDQPVKTPEL